MAWAHRIWRRMCATTALGCAPKRRNASATSIRRSKSRRRWPTERPDLKPLVGQKLTVIAWLWARTVKSPNPAFSHVDVPLASTFILSSKEGKEAYVQPSVEGDQYRFTVKMGTPPPEAEAGTKASGDGANFRCLVSGTPIAADYIRAEAQAGRMGQRLMAIVAEGQQRSNLSFANPEKARSIAAICNTTLET